MKMRRTLALALLASAIPLGAGPAPRAQEEPPLFEEPPAQPAPSPAPETPAAPAAAPAPRPAPGEPLRPSLDFARWQEMSARERQTFVEGAVNALGIVSARLRAEVSGDSRMTPDRAAAVVRFVRETFPRHAPAAYLREMEAIYLTAEGQKLPMIECFFQAFRRLNAR
jgi:hypothetical protein